jgi:hypothetical protein
VAEAAPRLRHVLNPRVEARLARLRCGALDGHRALAERLEGGLFARAIVGDAACDDLETIVLCAGGELETTALERGARVAGSGGSTAVAWHARSPDEGEERGE